MRSSIDFGSRTKVGSVIRERSIPGRSWPMIPMMIDFAQSDLLYKLHDSVASYLLVVLEDNLTFLRPGLAHDSQ